MSLFLVSEPTHLEIHIQRRVKEVEVREEWTMKMLQACHTNIFWENLHNYKTQSHENWPSSNVANLLLIGPFYKANIDTHSAQRYIFGYEHLWTSIFNLKCRCQNWIVDRHRIKRKGTEGLIKGMMDTCIVSFQQVSYVTKQSPPLVGSITSTTYLSNYNYNWQLDFVLGRCVVKDIDIESYP